MPRQKQGQVATANGARAAIMCLLLAHGAGCTSGPTSPSTSPQATAPTPVALRGSVHDTRSRPLAGVTVSSVSTPDVVTFSDANGQFSIAASKVGGFDSAALFRAEKDGYLSESRTLGSGLSFVLTALAPAVNLAGEYTLTIVADAACAVLPAELRTRTYIAEFFGATDIVVGSVRGATFVEGLTDLDAHIAGDVVSFTTDVHGPGWIVEEIGPDIHLAFRGVATARVDRPLSAIAAAFEGVIEYCTANVPLRRDYKCAVTHARACVSNNHQFLLTKR